MAESVMYHEGNRQLQDQFDSRGFRIGWKRS